MSEQNILNLDGRTALVTGAGQGVGRSIATMLAAHGATVIVNDFHEGRAVEAATAILSEGGQAVAVHGDVSDYVAVATTVADLAERGLDIDILVNNAGNAGTGAGSVNDPTPFWESDPQDWARWIDTNLYGVLNTTRATLPGMVDRGWGRVVNIISDAGRVGEPNFVVYGGAKAGAAGFSRGLAKATGRHGVTVNCISLATMKTLAVAEFLENEALTKQMLRSYVVRRFGEPHDAAAMALFLSSNAASWITGQTYPVNGGYSFAV